MSFLKLPAIGEKELKVSLTVFPSEIETAQGIERGHILYGVWAVDVSDKLPILFVNPQDLFFSRMESLYEWFRDRYGEIE